MYVYHAVFLQIMSNSFKKKMGKEKESFSLPYPFSKARQAIISTLKLTYNGQ